MYYVFSNVFDYTQILPFPLKFSSASWIAICFLWDWFCLFHTYLSLVPLAILKSGDSWLPIHSHKWKTRLTVISSWLNLPHLKNIYCPCWIFPSLGGLAVCFETKGVVWQRPGFTLGCVKVKQAVQLEVPSVSEKKSPLKSNNLPGQITCSLWRVDVWLQTRGQICRCPPRLGKGRSSNATICRQFFRQTLLSVSSVPANFHLHSCLPCMCPKLCIFISQYTVMSHKNL